MSETMQLTAADTVKKWCILYDSGKNLVFITGYGIR